MVERNKAFNSFIKTFRLGAYQNFSDIPNIYRIFSDMMDFVGVQARGPLIDE